MEKIEAKINKLFVPQKTYVTIHGIYLRNDENTKQYVS